MLVDGRVEGWGLSEAMRAGRTIFVSEADRRVERWYGECISLAEGAREDDCRNAGCSRYVVLLTSEAAVR